MKRDRIIINIDCKCSLSGALEYVHRVIDSGLISANGTEYCYVTSFRDGTVVYSDRRKSGTHSFVVAKDQQAQGDNHGKGE
jgi:hypothetical protein